MNLVVNGGFNITGSNPPATASFSSDYYFNPATASLPEGSITINTNASQNHIHWWGTGLSGTNDPFLLCNGYQYNTGNYKVWEQSLTGLQPNADYYFSFSARALGDYSFIAYNNPRVQFYVNGNPVTFSNVFEDPGFTTLAATAIIPRSQPGEWTQICGSWNSGANTSAVLKILMATSNATSTTLWGDDLGIDNIQFSYIKSPIVIETSVDTICAGQNVMLGTLLNVSGGTPPYSYLWNTGSTLPNPLVYPPFTIAYTVTITDAEGCQSTAQTTVYVVKLPGRILGANHNCDTIAWYTFEALPPGYQVAWSILDPTVGSILNITPDADSARVQWTVFYPSPGPHLQAIVTSGTCSDTLQLTIYKCCCQTPGNSVSLIDDTLSGTPVVYQNTVICIQGTLFIDTKVTFGENTLIYMAPDTRIIINEADTLILEANVVMGETCGDYLWDGIYVTHPNSMVMSMPDPALDEAIVKNAKNAIVSQNGGNFLLRNIRFHDNWTSIKVSDYFAGVPNFQTPHPGQIFGCTFDNTWPDERLHLIPHIGEPIFCGIQIENVDGITIGDVNIKNHFYRMQNGFHIANARVSLAGNHFFYIPIDNTYSWPPAEAAINARGLFGAGAYVKGNLSVGYNYFDNSFLHCYTGISFFGRNQVSYIKGNQFTHCNYAIYGVDVAYPTYIIDNHVGSGISGQDLPGTGITVKNASSQEARIDLRVIGNSIHGMYNGINLVNHTGRVQVLQVALNTVNFYDKAPPKRYGINIEGCHFAEVQANYIHNAFPVGAEFKKSIRGIRVSVSQHGLIKGNFIHNLGSGILTNGIVLNTQFLCNILDSCYHGFFFGQGTALSDQVILSSIDADNPWNLWQGVYNSPVQSKVSTDAGNMVLNSVLYYQENNGSNDFKLDNDIGTINHPCYTKLLPIDNPDTNMCVYLHPVPGKLLDSLMREVYFGQILRNEHAYVSYLPEYRFYEKDYLYRFFMETPSNLSLGHPDDVLYQQLMDSLSGSETGIVNTVKRLIAENKLDSAEFVNQWLSNTDQWMENFRMVYAVYIITWARNLFDYSGEDSTTLLDVALQTPYEGGPAVYTARVMLNLDPEDYGTPYRQLIPSGPQDLPSLKIIPNPASTVVQVILPMTYNGIITLETSNSSGQRVDKQFLTATESQVIYRPDHLPAGFYFLSIKSPLGCLGQGKLIIIK